MLAVPALQAGGAGAGDGVPIELPDFFSAVGPGLFPPWLASILDAWAVNIFALACLFALSAVLLRGAANQKEIPRGVQNAVEALVEWFHGLLGEILGRHAGRFIPFLGTLFLFILFMNLSGLIPLFRAPTSQFEITLSLAIVVFLYVQATAIRSFGPLGYLRHLMGSPEGPAGWLLAPMMLPIHLVSEIARPFSLALRLFGNVMGEHALIAAFTALGVTALGIVESPVGLPLGLPFIFLAVLFGMVQAFVFTLLSAVYLSQVLPSEEDHGHAQRL